uniref:Uncharacterized protein n=1 Tax=Glossina morsitans morsitans TaxID=37546 RepID=A0A1B0FG30_GLOMM
MALVFFLISFCFSVFMLYSYKKQSLEKSFGFVFYFFFFFFFSFSSFHNILMSSHKICRRLGTSRAVQLNNMFILAHRLSVPLLSLLSGRLTGRVTGWLARWLVADNQCVVCYSILSFKTVGGA